MPTPITCLEWGALKGRRPRAAGSNARLGAHGGRVHVPLLRVTTQNGASGFSVCHAGPSVPPPPRPPGYALKDGAVSVPDAPGFGLSLDQAAFTRAVADGGWRLDFPA